MTPKHDHLGNETDELADLKEPGTYTGMRRFGWKAGNPRVTIIDFSHMGTIELVRNVPTEHARYLWARLIKKGWIRNDR